MSKQNELRVFEQNIAIRGVKFTRTGLQFEQVDEDLLVEVGAFLQAVDACSAWWWGDFLAEYCGWSLRKDEIDAGSKFDPLTAREKVKHYTARYASICDREPKTLSHWKSVSDFFKSSRRREDLSHGHHIEAMNAAAGDQAIADNWLELAEKHNWSVSQLRSAIRKAKWAKEEPEEPMPQLCLPMEVVSCRRWASAAIHRVDDMDLDEAKALLLELEQVAAVIAALARRVAPGGKESILRAA